MATSRGVQVGLAAFLALGSIAAHPGCRDSEKIDTAGPSETSRAARTTKQEPNSARSATALLADASGGKRYPILLESLTKVLKRYVEPDRLNPPAMALKALVELQEDIASVQVKVLRPPEKDRAGLVEVTVFGASARFVLPPDLSPQGAFQLLTKVLDFVAAGLERAGELSDDQDKKLQYAVVDGILETLDPYSVLLKPEDFQELEIRTQGSFGGIGIVISIRKGALTVISPIDGTPAARAGLKPGDRIVRIGSESTVNMPLHEAVKRLRGKVGTKVTFWVERTGWPQPRKFTLTRARIEIHSVRGKLLPGKVGYVRVSRFSGNTRAELSKALRKLEDAGAKGIILDLTNNPGGLLSQAVAVVDSFVDYGVVVTTRGAAGLVFEKWTASPQHTLWKGPLLVLVNRGSASASEIVAGALKALGRAVVVGERTFGKGSVQVLMRNEDGSALKLTVARYYVHGDVPIQTVGVTPDLALDAVVLKKDWVYFRDPEASVGEADLVDHLAPAERIRKEKPKYRLRYLLEEEEPKEDKWKDETETGAPSPVLRLARLLLLQAGGTREQILEGLPDFVRAEQAAQDVRIATAAKRLGLDWTAGPVPQQPSIETTVSFLPHGPKVRSGDEFKIRLTARNTGDQPLFRTRAILRAGEYYLADRQFPFGRLAPGEARSWTISFKVPRYEWTQRLPIRFVFYSDMHRLTPRPAGAKKPSDEALLKPDTYVDIQQLPRPRLVLSYRATEAEGDGDGLLEPGERATIAASVQNEGPGETKEAVVFLRNLSGRAVFVEKGRAVIPRLSSTGRKTVRLAFRLQAGAWAGSADPPGPPKSIKLELGVQHAPTRIEFHEKLSLDLAQPIGRLRGTLVPPKILVDELPVWTNGSRVHFRCRVEHPRALKDVYVFVSNSRGRGYRRKVFYRAAAGKREVEIEGDVELPIGANTIIVMARATNELSAFELRRVLRVPRTKAPRPAARDEASAQPQPR